MKNIYYVHEFIAESRLKLTQEWKRNDLETCRWKQKSFWNENR